MFTMNKRQRYLSVALICAVFVGLLFWMSGREGKPLLKVVESRIASGRTQTIAVFRDHLWTECGPDTAYVRLDDPVAKELVDEISAAARGNLALSYSDPSVACGVLCSFEFNVSGVMLGTTVCNEYVPELIRLVDRCNSLLPSGLQMIGSEMMEERLQSNIESLGDAISLYEANKPAATESLEQLREKRKDLQLRLDQVRSNAFAGRRRGSLQE